MNIVQFMEISNKWMLRVLKLIYLNFLWMLGTVVGLGIFGIGPATVALSCVLREWLQQNEDESVTQTFIKYYKENFKEACITGILFLAIGYIIMIDLHVVQTWVFRFAAYLGIIISFASLLYTPNLIAHYELVTIRKRLQMSLVLSITYLQYTIVGMLAMLVFSLIIIFFIPLVIPLIFISGNSLIAAFISRNVFAKVDATIDFTEKEEKKEENDDE